MATTEQVSPSTLEQEPSFPGGEPNSPSRRGHPILIEVVCTTLIVAVVAAGGYFAWTRPEKIVSAWEWATGKSESKPIPPRVSRAALRRFGSVACWKNRGRHFGLERIVRRANCVCRSCSLYQCRCSYGDEYGYLGRVERSPGSDQDISDA